MPNILLMGSSAVFVADPGEPSLYTLVEEELRLRAPASEWRVMPELLHYASNMAERGLAMVDRHQPDVAVVVVSSNVFLVELVFDQRRETLYKAGRAVSSVLRRLAGGGLDGSESIRGAVFRGPQAFAKQILGTRTWTTMPLALSHTTEALAALLTREDLPIVCRAGPWAFRPVNPRAAQRAKQLAEAYNSAVAQYCAQHHIAFYDLGIEMERANEPLVYGKDEVHLGLPLRRFEAAIMAKHILQSLGIEARDSVQL